MNEHEHSDVITVKGVPYYKAADGTLVKLSNEDYDESCLIYR